jgi:hypothetical protein
MQGSTSDLQHDRKWVLASHRESQMTVGQRLRVERQGPQELPHKQETPRSRRDGEEDPRAPLLPGFGRIR